MDSHEAANIFPLDEEHIPELAKDIKKHGLLTPIETLDGKILDGRRRFLACKKAQVKPEFTDVKGLTEDPVAYVLSANLHRRHLTVSQAAQCADRAEKLREALTARGKERMSAGGGDKKSAAAKSAEATRPHPIRGPQTRDELAEAFGISGRTVQRAKRVREKGIPALNDAVVAGKITVNAASVIAGQPAELQQQLVDAALQKTQAQSPKTKANKDNGKTKPVGELQGVGIIRANEAINSLKRIPKKDRLRKRGFQLVTDWIKHNR